LTIKRDDDDDDDDTRTMSSSGPTTTLLCCPICFEEFSSIAEEKEPRTPMMGQCGHNICRGCLYDTIQHTYQERGPKIKNLDCPMCRQSKMFRTDQLIPNRALCQALQVGQAKTYLGNEQTKEGNETTKDISELHEMVECLGGLCNAETEKVSKMETDMRKLRESVKQLEGVCRAKTNKVNEMANEIQELREIVTRAKDERPTKRRRNKKKKNVTGHMGLEEIEFTLEGYKGSEEERKDVLKQYKIHGGNLVKMLAYVVGSSEKDVPRWMEDYIYPAISRKEVGDRTDELEASMHKINNNASGHESYSDWETETISEYSHVISL